VDTKQQQTALIAYLESALEFAEKLHEPTAAYLIERHGRGAKPAMVGSATIAHPVGVICQVARSRLELFRTNSSLYGSPVRSLGFPEIP